MSRTKIAIQSKGRLHDRSVEFLRSVGLDFTLDDRSLLSSCKNSESDILSLRDDDIPEYVSGGVADFGIVGENVLLEKNASVRVLKKLGFSKCRLVIAVPKNSGIKTIQDLDGERIATSYPRLLGNFLRKNRIHAAIIPISGSVEVAPELNLADAICDLTQSGKTLQAHNLVELMTILESEAVLIESPFKKSNTFSLFS